VKSNTSLVVAVAALFTLFVGGCKSDLQSGSEIGVRGLSKLCLGVVDAQADSKRAKRKLKNAEIELAGIRAQILRTEKRNAVIQAALAQGVQGGGGRYSTGEGDYYSSYGGDGIRLLAWADTLLSNESIEAQAQNYTWFVELRHAKDEYEFHLDIVDGHEEDIQHARSQMRAAGVRDADCRSKGYW